jgi:hypothetical protein
MNPSNTSPNDAPIPPKPKRLKVQLIEVHGKSSITSPQKRTEPLSASELQLRAWLRDMEENPHGPRKVLPPWLTYSPPTPPKEEPPPEKKAG